MSIKYTLVVADDGTVTGTSEDQTIAGRLIDGITLPFGVTAESNEVVSKKDAAFATIGYSVAMLAVGEAYGHKRARQGMQSYLPIFR